MTMATTLQLQSLPYESITIETTQTGYITSLGVTIHAGECVLLHDNANLGIGMSTKFGIITEMPIIKIPVDNSEKQYVSIQWLVPLYDVCRVLDLSVESKVPQPPLCKPYVEYSTFVVQTNLVQLVAITDLRCKAYAHSMIEYENGPFYQCVGMENAITIYLKKRRD